MRLINKTDYPTDEVRKLVRYGMRDLDGLKGAVVEVIPARKWCSGEAWHYERRIVIRLAPEACFPFEGYKRHKNGPVNHDWQTWREALVALAAHEGRHLHLFHHHYNNGKNRKAGEMNCEAHEHAMLQEYRRALQKASERLWGPF